MKKLLSINLDGQTFDTWPEETILDAALRNEIKIPSSCHSVSCGACRVKVIEGNSLQAEVKRIGLTKEELSEGFILTCISTPLTDMKISCNL